jgi:hypothetical protein
LGIIKADVIELGKKKPDQMAATLIDITVKNTGPATIVVTGAEFRVNFMEHLGPCQGGGGPVRISGYYTIRLPGALPKTPFITKRSIRHEIKPNGVDRFVFSVGVGEVSVDIFDVNLYQFDVLIHHDDPSTPNPVFAGSALLSNPIYAGARYGEEHYREAFGPLVPPSDQSSKKYNECIEVNREKARRFFQLPGHRAPSVDAIEAAWKT